MLALRIMPEIKVTSQKIAEKPLQNTKNKNDVLRYIKLRGAKTNCLKNIDVDIPQKKFTVVTGVSGSGKSSLVFDTLFAEGQRRYVESLSTYTRQFLEKMPKPDIESIENICPSIALEQKNHINNSRSTVATMSEIYDYLRLLFSKIGRTFCTKCGAPVLEHSSETVAREIEKLKPDARFYVLAPIPAISKKEWPDTRKFLMSSGFERIALSNDQQDLVLELSEVEKIPTKVSTVALVIDRMARPEKPVTDARLRDALDQAFGQGNGKLTIGVVEDSNSRWRMLNFSNAFSCDACGTTHRKPEPQFFSFNSPLGACSDCSGFGFNLELDEDLVVPEKRKTLKNGAVDPFTKPAYQEWHHDLIKFCEKHKIPVGKRYEDLTQEQKNLIWNGDGAKKGFPGINGCFEELKAWKYKLYVRVFIRRYQTQRMCNSCKGSRLGPQSLSVFLPTEPKKNIAEVVSLPIIDADRFFSEMNLNSYDQKVAEDVLKQIRGRLSFLKNVGVGYLTLGRLAKTLSGGECQRINLATQLGNRLCSTLYVLDEPSIGLHPEDTEKLITLLHQLRDHGNSLVVVEHDLDLIASADHIIELGPHAGHRGGEVVAAGSLQEVLNNKGCLTAKYLSRTFSIEKRVERRPRGDKTIRIEGACENNLKDLELEIPLHQLVAVTGLSGSGKTTLIHRTLYNALHRLFHRENVDVGKFRRLYGADSISDVVMLDQKPIGRSARSNPATYLKIWDDVRKIYSNQSLSIRRGFSPQYFSFNVDGGRCPVCKGEGSISLDMHFMADVQIPCDECEGRKFKKTVLEVEFKKKNVFQLLGTTIEECIDLFREYPAVSSKLQTLKRVGLGYLQLGQSSTTLSGGESQRLKIASVLEGKMNSNVLYIFDEPTTGLHVDDVRKLIRVLHELVDQRNTVLVIEHNLDVIAQADWVVDLGPGGGETGGQIVGCGTPEELINIESSLTGKHLRKILAE